MNRFLISVLVFPTVLLLHGSIAAQTVADYRDVTSFDKLCELAKSTAAAPFSGRTELPKAFRDLSYEQFREIQFRHESATWFESDLPFWLETFHRGFVQKDRVELFTIADGKTRSIPFSTSHFSYGNLPSNIEVPEDLGHAGLRVAGRFTPEGDGQEMLTFIGSSYFRGRSAETVYGSSARGLAIDIATERTEEFPFFRAFWIAKPEAQDHHLVVLALMDSPAVSGAYQFRFLPGQVESKVHVTARLSFRDGVDQRKIGLAPLTSMWIWGDGLAGPAKDKRPSVHDADGLLIRSGDEWTWRPFARHPYPSVSHQCVATLSGFGVMQRNRAFFHYDDHNAKYHLRPSVWITPTKPWVNGRVELLELPGAHEGIDNIGAYWVPDQPLENGQPIELDYEVAFFPGDHSDEKLGRATNLSVDRLSSSESITITVRFAGGPLADLSAEHAPLATFRVRDATIQSYRLKRTDTGDWITDVTLEPLSEAPMDLRLQLTQADKPLTESLWYLCPVKQPEFQYPQVYTRTE